MKLNKYFMIGAMGLSLVACSDNLDDNQGVNGNASNEGTTYASFTLDFKGVSSRAVGLEGTQGEQGITEAYVVMADDGTITNVIGGIIANATEYTTGGSANEEGMYNVDNSVVKYLLKTEEGPHTFYAVVNPDNAPKENQTIAEYFNAGVALSINNIAVDNKFMMASQEAKTVNIDDDVTEEDALEGELNTANNFEIVVERVSAKVTVTAANAKLTGDAGGTIAKEAGEDGTPGTIFNLKGIASKAYRMAQSSVVEIAENSWSDSKEGVAVHFGAYNDDNVSAAYCLENLHANGAYTQDNVTYITIKTTFIPGKVVNCDWDGVSADNALKTYSGAAASFYVVATGDLAGNYILKSDLDTYKASHDNALPNGVESINEEKLYENGECWFGPIWLGLADQNVNGDAPVYRNTWYDVEITGINLPGDPQEPEIHEDWPLVPATNVAIRLKVADWSYKKVEVNL